MGTKVQEQIILYQIRYPGGGLTSKHHQKRQPKI